MDTQKLIARLRIKPEQSIMSFIGCAYVMNNEEDPNFGKVKWYVTTAYSLLEEDFELSSDELNEFVRLHMHYVNKINTERIKIPLMELLDRADLLTALDQSDEN